jgi:hypothetical protein
MFCQGLLHHQVTHMCLQSSGQASSGKASVTGSVPLILPACSVAPIMLFRKYIKYYDDDIMQIMDLAGTPCA